MSEKIGATLEKPFYHKAGILQRITLETLARIYTPIIHVQGFENLKMAQNLRLENKRLIILSNHLTNGDAEIIYQVMKRNGFKDISKALFFLEGEKLRRTFGTRYLTRSQNGVFVWPKSLPTQNEEEEKIQRSMNIGALRDTKKALMKGHILVAFPEGGRSYEGKLKEAEPEIVHFIKLVENTVILPLAISGIEKVIPPGKKLIFPNPFQRINVNIGNPIDATSLLKHFEDFPKEERNFRIIDLVMRMGIAPLLSQEDQGVYATKV